MSATCINHWGNREAARGLERRVRWRWWVCVAALAGVQAFWSRGGLRALGSSAKERGDRGLAHRGSNRAVPACRGAGVDGGRRRARRSSGTGAAAVGAEGSGSGKIQASRRSRRTARPGLRRGGMAWPRRSRVLRGNGEGGGHGIRGGGYGVASWLAGGGSRAT